MTTTVSVPGRVVLGGDHSKLLGGSILAAAIDLRLRVTLADRSDDRVTIEGPLANASAALADVFEGDDVEDSLVVSTADRDLAVFPLLRAVLADAGIDAPTTTNGFDVKIAADSDLELGVGLASSTAVISGLWAAFHDHVGDRLDDAELADRVAAVEAERYSDASVVDPHAIVRGGVVYADADGSVSRADLSAPVVLGVGQPKTARDEVEAHVEALGSELGPLFETADDLADSVTAELWASVRDEDSARIRTLLTFYGDVLETLGLASWPIPEARAMGVARDADAGVKQSDFGRRATLVGVPASDDVVALERGFAGSLDPIVTEIDGTGLQYHDET